MTSYDFQNNQMMPADQWARPGKPEWPDCLTVTMDRMAATRILQQIAHQLESALANGNIVVSLQLVGALQQIEDDDVSSADRHP